MYNFNINNSINVKLKEKGIQHYADFYNKNFETIKNRLNPNGYLTLQFHIFMNVFGNQGLYLQDLIYLDLLFEEDVFTKI